MLMGVSAVKKPVAAVTAVAVVCVTGGAGIAVLGGASWYLLCAVGALVIATAAVAIALATQRRLQALQEQTNAGDAKRDQCLQLLMELRQGQVKQLDVLGAASSLLHTGTGPQPVRPHTPTAPPGPSRRGIVRPLR